MEQLNRVLEYFRKRKQINKINNLPNNLISLNQQGTGIIITECFCKVNIENTKGINNTFPLQANFVNIYQIYGKSL